MPHCLMPCTGTAPLPIDLPGSWSVSGQCPLWEQICCSSAGPAKRTDTAHCQQVSATGFMCPCCADETLHQAAACTTAATRASCISNAASVGWCCQAAQTCTHTTTASADPQAQHQRALAPWAPKHGFGAGYTCRAGGRNWPALAIPDHSCLGSPCCTCCVPLPAAASVHLQDGQRFTLMTEHPAAKPLNAGTQQQLHSAVSTNSR